MRALWRPLQTLPPEEQGTLLRLLLLVWVILPHATRLPLWCVAGALALLAWRAVLLWQRKPLPTKRVLGLLLVLIFALTGFSHHTFLTKDAGVTLAVALAAIKTLESRSGRDQFVLFLVSVFLILTHFLYSQSLAAVAGMVVAVWGLLTLQMRAQARVHPIPWSVAAAGVARLCLWGSPLLLALFFLFPRMGPLWGVAESTGVGTGLNDRIQMGSVAALSRDESIVMHVHFEGPIPPSQQLYFRAVVLTEFDGQTWSPSPQAQALPRPSDQAPSPTARAFRYHFELAPSSLPYLPTLDRTWSLSAADNLLLKPARSGVWLAGQPLSKTHRFDAQGGLSPRHAFDHSPQDLARSLRLPSAANPRLHAWAAALRDDPRHANADAHTWVQTLMAMIRTEGFLYTLQPGRYTEAQAVHAIDTFWFETKAGFCEHFASAMVVALRELGVPARLVVGYQGLEYNPVGAYHVVRNSQAHAWVEYWHADTGWMRVDPTSALTPQQLTPEAQIRPPPGVSEAMAWVRKDAFGRAMRQRVEALAYQWNRWVVHYEAEQQMALLQELGFSAPTTLTLWLSLVGCVFVVLGLSMWSARSRRARPDLWWRRYQTMVQDFAQAGVVVPAQAGPRALSQAVQAAWPAHSEALVAVLLRMEWLRYGPHAMTEAELRQALHQLSGQCKQALRDRVAALT